MDVRAALRADLYTLWLNMPRRDSRRRDEKGGRSPKGEELPVVFGLIGPAALPALAAYLADLSHADSSRISAIASLKKIGKQWPDARAETVAMLEERLEHFEENEPDVNAILVEVLVELGAKQAALLIERAFAEGYVDPIVMGDWEDV